MKLFSRPRSRAIVTAVAAIALVMPFSTSAQAASADENDPQLVSEIQEPDGTLIQEYSDGSSFTSGPIEDAPLEDQPTGRIAAAAAKGGSFNFSAKWGSSLKSRKWTTKKKANIYVHFGKISNCGKKNELTLRKSSGAKVGSTRKMSCSAKTYTWKLAASGTYYFDLVSQAPTGGRLQKSSGKVAYDGAGA